MAGGTEGNHGARTGSTPRAVGDVGNGGAGRPARSGQRWPEESLLGLLGPRTRAAFGALGRRRVYAAGETIVLQGDMTGFVAVLVTGIAKVTAVSENGVETLLAIRVGGEALTEFAVLDSSPRSASVTAVTESGVQVVGAEEFTDFLDTHPNAQRALQRSLVGKLRTTVDLQVVLADAVPLRLATLLLGLADKFGYGTADDASVDVPLSQADLASLIGASQVSVNKALRELKAAGVVAVAGHRRHVIRDLPRLRAIAKVGH